MRLAHAVFPALIFALACGGGQEALPPASEVAVLSPIDLAAVVRQPIATGPRISGSLEPAVKAVLRAEASGTVVELGAELGDRIAAGAPLARVDNRAVAGNVSSARSSVAAAQQDLENARRDLERTRTLAAAGAVSGRDIETGQAQVAAAEARVQQARAGLTSAGEQLDGVNVRSPIAGIVSQRSVSVGDVVSPGTPLFTVIDPSSLRLVASVPAGALSQVAPGAKVLFEVQGYADKRFEGVVDRVSPAVDPVTRQLGLLVSVPNADGALIAGLFADGRVAGDNHDGLVIPTDAVDRTGAVPTVLRITAGHVEQVQVQLGDADLGTEQVEVVSGLTEGDQLIVGAARDVAPGAAVEVRQEN